MVNKDFHYITYILKLMYTITPFNSIIKLQKSGELIRGELLTIGRYINLCPLPFIVSAALVLCCGQTD